MKYIFGKSEAAIMLEELVSSNPYIQARVSSHISDYFEYVKEISKIKNKVVRLKALEHGLECDLLVSDDIKNFIRNIKVAKRREMLSKV